MSTRLAITILALACFAAGALTGRATATPRPALAIPTADTSAASRTPERPEAPLGTSRIQPEVVRRLASNGLRAGDEDRTPASGASLTGKATWYDGPPGQAAAGPALRKFLGPKWRGTIVRVCAGERCVTARLSDWCACRDRHGVPTVIDLDDALFRALSPLSRGVVAVEVRRA